MGFVSTDSNFVRSRASSDVAPVDAGGMQPSGFIRAGDALYFTGNGVAPLLSGADAAEFRGVAINDWPNGYGVGTLKFYREGIVLFAAAPDVTFALDALVYIVDDNAQLVSTTANGSSIGRVALDQSKATPGQTVAVVITPVF